MVVYADSSFLLKLYIREPDTPAALAAVSTVARPLIFSALHRLELSNAIRRNVASKKVRKSQAVHAFQILRRDLRSGFYSVPAVSWEAIYRRALRLSRKHARTFQVRSLDLLHVAAAIQSGATQFLTFDARQGLTAQSEGFIVLP